jgi:cardiolipin synthase A/B
MRLSAEVEVLIRQAAGVLPPEHARRVAAAVEALPTWSPLSSHQAQRAVPAAPTRRFVAGLCEAWRTTCPDVPGGLIAVALRMAAAVAEEMEGRGAIDIVWTGPATASAPPRLTAAVLQELIRTANVTLHILTFATYRVQSVLDDLAAAAGRGVAVTMIAETVDDSGGKLTRDVIALYREIPSLALYTWPRAKRPAVGNGVAAMHAKAAVADSGTALISSANLTGSGLDSNMELGVLVRRGDFASALVRHLHELISMGVLQRVE